MIVAEDFVSEADLGSRRNLISLFVPEKQIVNQFHSNLVSCLGGTDLARYG